MARINIEDSIYKDARFDELKLKLGSVDAALGAMVRAWSLAQKFYLNEQTNRLIPIAEWNKQKINPSIIDCDLAEIRNEFVYVSGSNEQFAWLMNCQNAGKKGGRPPNAIKPTTEKPSGLPPKGSERVGKPLTLSLTLSQKEELRNVLPDDSTHVMERFNFENIYKQYPRRQGNQRKAAGMKSLQKLVKFQSDFELVEKSVQNYQRHCKQNKIEGTPMVAMFATFFGRDEIWKEWISRESDSKKILPEDFSKLAFGGL